MVSLTGEPECGELIYSASSTHSASADYNVFDTDKASVVKT